MDDLTDPASFCRHFALHEAKGESATFARGAEGVGQDAEVLDLLEQLPLGKRQPNLVFVAARWHGTLTPSTYPVLRETLLRHWPEVRETILARSTQTNEVGRCATLLPLLAMLAGQGLLALIEGARAPGCACIRTGGPIGISTIGGRCAPSSIRGRDAPRCCSSVGSRGRRRCRRGCRRWSIAGACISTRSTCASPVPRSGWRRSCGPSTRTVGPAWPRRIADTLERVRADGGRAHWVSNEGAGVLRVVSASATCAARETDFCLGLDGRAVGWTHGHGHRLTWC